MIDCWNTVGVRGDGSCPELAQHAHCRNCPVYASAAVELLRSAPPDASLDERTAHFAQPKPAADLDSASAFVFRIGDEWLALPTHVISEIANPKGVHTLPHKTAGAMLGVTNIRGELVIAMSLGRLLGLAPGAPAPLTASRTQFARLLVLRRDTARIACPVDEVHGVVRFGRSALRELPATLAKAGTRYSTKLLNWNGRSVGMLDDQLLFYSLKRSIA